MTDVPRGCADWLSAVLIIGLPHTTDGGREGGGWGMGDECGWVVATHLCWLSVLPSSTCPLASPRLDLMVRLYVARLRRFSRVT